jgi:hypothetical protein
MSVSTKFVDKIEGVENLCVWKYRIGLILEENDLSKFIKENGTRRRYSQREVQEGYN